VPLEIPYASPTDDVEVAAVVSAEVSLAPSRPLATRGARFANFFLDVLFLAVVGAIYELTPAVFLLPRYSLARSQVNQPAPSGGASSPGQLTTDNCSQPTAH